MLPLPKKDIRESEKSMTIEHNIKLVVIQEAWSNRLSLTYNKEHYCTILRTIESSNLYH